jgi:hypothetical protein
MIEFWLFGFEVVMNVPRTPIHQVFQLYCYLKKINWDDAMVSCWKAASVVVHFRSPQLDGLFRLHALRFEFLVYRTIFASYWKMAFMQQLAIIFLKSGIE